MNNLVESAVGEILDHDVSKIEHDADVDISHLRRKCVFDPTFLHDSDWMCRPKDPIDRCLKHKASGLLQGTLKLSTFVGFLLFLTRLDLKDHSEAAKKTKTKNAAQVVARSARHGFIVRCGVCDPLLFLSHTSWLLSPASPTLHHHRNPRSI